MTLGKGRRALPRTGRLPVPTTATITCPHCGHAEAVDLPDGYDLADHVCAGCATRLRAPPGGCCVYCAFADMPCLPEQTARANSCGSCD